MLSTYFTDTENMKKNIIFYATWDHILTQQKIFKIGSVKQNNNILSRNVYFCRDFLWIQLICWDPEYQTFHWESYPGTAITFTYSLYVALCSLKTESPARADIYIFWVRRERVTRGFKSSRVSSAYIKMAQNTSSMLYKQKDYCCTRL